MISTKKIVQIFFSGLIFTLLSSFVFNLQAKNKVYKWKIAMSWSKSVIPLSSPPQNFAKLVEIMSNGRMKIKVHGPEKHKAAGGI